MNRAQAEHEMRGIRTTILIFRRSLEHEVSMAAQFATSFLDGKLGARNGEPLSVADDGHAVVAAVAVAMRQVTGAAAAVEAAAAELPSRWQQAARHGALR